jgi:hypothetical protein
LQTFTALLHAFLPIQRTRNFCIDLIDAADKPVASVPPGYAPLSHLSAQTSHKIVVEIKIKIRFTAGKTGTSTWDGTTRAGFEKSMLDSTLCDK